MTQTVSQSHGEGITQRMTVGTLSENLCSGAFRLIQSPK